MAVDIGYAIEQLIISLSSNYQEVFWQGREYDSNYCNGFCDQNGISVNIEPNTDFIRKKNTSISVDSDVNAISGGATTWNLKVGPASFQYSTITNDSDTENRKLDFLMAFKDQPEDTALCGDMFRVANTYKNLEKAILSTNVYLSCFKISDDFSSLIEKILHHNPNLYS